MLLRIPVDFASLKPVAGAVLFLLLFAALYHWAGTRFSPVRRPAAVVADYFLSLAQGSAAVTALLPLSYLTAAAGFPLLDGELTRLDAALGFDWDTAARWVGERPVLGRLLQFAYFSVPAQAAVILLLGSMRQPGSRNSEFIWLLLVSAVLTAAVAVFTPAAGKTGHLDYMDQLMAIRNGGWQVMSYADPKGIVTFPSYHAAEAVLLTYLARHTVLGLAAFGSLNALVIVATVPAGGHYLVDLPGGAAVAAVSIIAVRRMMRVHDEPAG
jgi:membrane-associated phospholipid phosphatase